MITAIVFIQAEVAQLSDIAEQIADIEGVSEVYSVTGELDLIAMVRVRDIDDVAKVVADQLEQGRRRGNNANPNRVPGLQPPRPRRRLQHRPLTPSAPR
ncbi:Lrp/AsnC family transcriptional regulator [Aeromicrobium sp. UC242_57]|uniref:Lrp/AsnC family transcriptional regulator n=1 Tax=Aeromicrobium sp. UC242_57 TaxID=3374624 RepID=UPI0037AD8C60